MSRAVDRSGQRFGRLVVLSRDPERSTHSLCRCDCGAVKAVNTGAMRAGQIQSCGCLRSERIIARNLDALGTKREAGLRADRIDLVGRRFGRLVVEAWAGVGPDAISMWSCICDCGVRATVRRHNLTTETTKSCGCLKREVAGANNRRHGESHSPMYQRWSSIKNRTGNPNDPRYGDYAGRGISMHPAWRESYERFRDDLLAECGPWPGKGWSLDRVDNDGNYEPGNVRWATGKTQIRNQRGVDRQVVAALETTETRLEAALAALAAVDPAHPLLIGSVPTD